MRILGILAVATGLSFAASEGRGGEITVSPTVVDFGLVSVAGPPAFGSVMITNTGSSTMVNGLSMGGCFGFAVGGPFPILLGNGQSVLVTVGFDPMARGPFNCNVTIQDSDPNTDTFLLTGVGTAPFLTVVHPPLSNPLVFADQPWDGGVAETLHVEIENSGNEAIQETDYFASLGIGQHFSAARPVFPIVPGSRALVLVTFDPASEGAKSDALAMGLHNDLPNEPDRIVNLSGTGTTPTTGVDPLVGRTGLRLLGSNPVTSATRFSFDTKEPGRVTLALFDITGRLVRSLHDEIVQAGSHEWAWSRGASQATPSGVYLVRLSLAGRTLGTSRVVVLKGLQ